jgi:hypothetical protein
VEDVRGGDQKLSQPLKGPIQDRPTDPSSHFSKSSQEVTPENKNPDPESQAAPAVKIQEGTHAEG